MSAATVSGPDELAVFDRWAASLAEKRAARLKDHIAVARAGAPWLRAWLMDIDRQIAAGATHIPSASIFADWDPAADNELLSVEESAAILRWLETGEGPSPWPDESRG